MVTDRILIYIVYSIYKIRGETTKTVYGDTFWCFDRCSGYASNSNIATRIKLYKTKLYKI